MNRMVRRFEEFIDEKIEYLSNMKLRFFSGEETEVLGVISLGFISVALSDGAGLFWGTVILLIALFAVMAISLVCFEHNKWQNAPVAYALLLGLTCFQVSGNGILATFIIILSLSMYSIVNLLNQQID